MRKISVRVSLPSLLAALALFATHLPAWAYGEVDNINVPETIVDSFCTALSGAVPPVAAMNVDIDGALYTSVYTPHESTNFYSVVRHRPDGKIDRTWGAFGLAGVPLSPVYRLVPAPDGSLLVVGNHVIRLDKYGRIDFTYGTSGETGVNGEFIASALLQNDGKLVIFETNTPATNWRFTRLMNNGDLDRTFGRDGVFTIPFSLIGPSPYAYGWAIESDGSIQLATARKRTVLPLEYQLEITRFRGIEPSIDKTFSAPGQLVPRQDQATWLTEEARVQPDGALVIGLEECEDENCALKGPSVFRFTPQGKLDTSFGDNGRRYLVQPRIDAFLVLNTVAAVMLEPQGGVTVLVRGFERFRIGGAPVLYAYRLTPSGQYDPAFVLPKLVGNTFEGAVQLADGRMLSTRAAERFVDTVVSGRISVTGGCAYTTYATDAKRDAAKVVEYYSPSTDHYFLTSQDEENDVLKSGQIGDWRRTGQVFGAYGNEAALQGSSPVCRFYSSGDPASHFHSAQKFECDLLAAQDAAAPPGQLAWRFERNDFRVAEPVGDVCPPNLSPLFRLYNRANMPAGGIRKPNFRYTTSYSIIAEMQAEGWLNEGVRMCVPPANGRDSLGKY